MDPASEEWLRPPTAPDGGPCVVDMRFAMFKVDAISAVSLSASIKIAIVWYWTDPRLAGWDADTPLPELLWGPTALCVNSRADFAHEQTQFELVDAATGRLKRGRMFHGSVDNDMNLRKFPFDVDDVEVKWETMGHWVSNDGSRYGTLSKSVSYVIRPIREEGEGDLVGVYFDGHIPEWRLLGSSVLIKRLPPTHQGTVRQKSTLSIHVSRKASFFFYKIILPLCTSVRADRMQCK